MPHHYLDCHAAAIEAIEREPPPGPDAGPDERTAAIGRLLQAAFDIREVMHRRRTALTN